ncbi:hypothetical protein OSB04_025453 [Centaurea solstitialis]|uniref:COP1-interacting protein 7 n=1 Tax=Centaurea solstitialis TaxID=347529 RepID=A0AA38T1H7_9ASTR|nr:hypothetical protein OSB04_025453 [Centaurea solstitialis]
MMLLKMERRIDPDAPLDYVELQIFPSHNRYEACVSVSNRAEKVASGDLQQLLSHLPQVKELSSQSSSSNFKILPPDYANDWFTTAKLTRFLLIVGSPDILNIANEISELEETRKFQLSLFARAEVDMTSSYESKNELLQTIDLRLSGLKEKLADALNQATGANCSPKDISDLENFAHHFGAEEIRDSLQKFVELSQVPSLKDSTTERNVSASQLNPPVKYGVSPAKAAQIERQSSTDSESSFSSDDEEQPSPAERSRTVARSATPRRSASPMRRVQIGRSGPRRAATLSIKSLNHFPAREKRDVAGHSSEDDDLEKSSKRNALRMSVQDKISLFENKKKDQDVDTQKPKTLSTAPVPNKAVLRRWSSGMSESAVQRLNDTSNKTSSPVSPKDATPHGNAESCVSQDSSETAENIKSSSPKNDAAETLGVEVNPEHERDGSCEKHPASIEWNQQKEAELNQLFTKMMESKPVRRQSMTGDNSKGKSSPKENRGGFYDHYKQKRDEKLRKEAAKKKAEKEAQFKEMHQFLDERKAEMTSTNTSDVVTRRHSAVNKPKNPQKNPTPLPNPRKEPVKASVVKKAASKPSPLPATRKSWPSTPSSQGATEASPAKTRSSVVSSSLFVQAQRSKRRNHDRRRLNQLNLMLKKTTKTVSEKKQPIAKSAQTAKPKVRTKVATPVATTATATTTTATAKPSFYNKVTKKSSVVPLETKPFLRKGTGVGPGAGAGAVVKKVVAQPDESLSSGDPIPAEKNQAVEAAEYSGQNQAVETAEYSGQNHAVETAESPEPVAKLDLETHAVTLSPTKCEESQSSNQFDVVGDDGLKKMEMSEFNNGVTEEESMISPTAWVEIEENQQDEIIQCKETSSIQTAGAGPTNLGAAAGVSSPRVRHSLFQMLLEETGEADSCDWGNAQNPPAMVCQKDAPKGFKRLLKFARKTKADLTDGKSDRSLVAAGSSTIPETKL